MGMPLGPMFLQRHFAPPVDRDPPPPAPWFVRIAAIVVPAIVGLVLVTIYLAFKGAAF